MKVKTYSLDGMKDRDMANLFRVVDVLGFGPESFRIVYFGSHSKELKVMDQKLHWVIKSLSKISRQKHAHTKGD